MERNKRVSKTEWEDARNKIVRTCAIQTFLVGAVGASIPWSIVSERRRDQEKGVNLALNVLIDMAGSSTVRTYIRNIENNRLTNNNTKDTELLKQLKDIMFESTGRTS